MPVFLQASNSMILQRFNICTPLVYARVRQVSEVHLSSPSNVSKLVLPHFYFRGRMKTVRLCFCSVLASLFLSTTFPIGSFDPTWSWSTTLMTNSTDWIISCTPSYHPTHWSAVKRLLQVIIYAKKDSNEQKTRYKTN